MEQKGILKIFISSTYRDLKEVRKLLTAEIDASLEAVAMEKFCPSDKSSHKESIGHLEDSDVCVFIIGDYYGTLIKDCKVKIDKCGNCTGNISYTHCEYRRALQINKPHLVYVIKNEIIDVLTCAQKLDIESTEENEILGFLKRNRIDNTRASLFLGYTVEQVEEFWKMAKDEKRERVERFKEEIQGLFRPVRISRKEDYYPFCETVRKDLKERIIRWYQDGRILFKDFAGRRKELGELLTKINEMKSVCVVGTGGIGKTSLIQLGLLLEKLSGRKIYSFLEEYSYNYTRAGYPFAKGRFVEALFSERVTLPDILKLVFQKDVRREDILIMDENDQFSVLTKELDREGSILFVDDLQDADENVKRFIYMCGNNLGNGAIVAGIRKGGGCFSTIGPLSGMRDTDLQEMITVLAKIHFKEEYIRDLDTWSREVFRITQGHPILVDILVRNANKFPNCGKLKGITGVTKVEEQNAVNEVMNRLISDILTEGELKILKILSIFHFPVNGRVLEMIEGETILYGIIEKGFLDWSNSKLVFTFEAIRELLEINVPVEYHDIAVEYYSEKSERANELEKHCTCVERIYHLLRRGRSEEAFQTYLNNTDSLQRGPRDRVIDVSNIALEKTTDEKMRAHILTIIGNLLLDGREFSGAEESLGRALIIYKELAKEEPRTYDAHVAGTLNNLGDLFTDTKNFEKAEKHYVEGLKIFRELVDRDSETYEPSLAMTYSNIGNLYNSSKEFEKAEVCYKIALKIRRKLVKRDPSIYKPRVAMTLNNLGNLYIDMNEYGRAKKCCMEALRIFRELVDEDHGVYEPNLAMTLSNLGNLYNRLKDSGKAERYYTEALEYYRDLAGRDPDAYRVELARTLNNIGALYTNMRKFDETEELLLEALRIRRELVEQYALTYEPAVAEALNNLGNLYSMLQRFREAEESYNEALEVYKRLADKYPDVYGPRLATVLHNLGVLYVDLEKSEEPERFFMEALKIRRKLAEKYPEVYKFYVAETLKGFGDHYWRIEKFEKAEKCYNKALEIYRELARKDLSAYGCYVAIVLGSLGGLFGDLRRFEEAEKSFSDIFKCKNIPPENKIKALFSLAIVREEMENENAYRIYFRAGVLSFSFLIESGRSSVNFLYCFQKVQELSPPDSTLNRMAAIAISGISKIFDKGQSTNGLNNLKLDDLPEICQAIANLITGRGVVQIRKPRNQIELMFYYIYCQLESKTR